MTGMGDTTAHSGGCVESDLGPFCPVCFMSQSACDNARRRHGESMTDDIGPKLLALWLTAHGYAEVERGYGHVTGEELAEALLATFVIKLPPQSGRQP